MFVACNIPCFLVEEHTLLFRYKVKSIKNSTCHGRDKGARNVYSLANTTLLPKQKFILTVTTNKALSIDLTYKDIILDKNDFVQHMIVATCSDFVPMEIHKAVHINRQDMATTQEEADTIIVQQVASVGVCTSLVVADGTDIFILLLLW